MKFHAAFGATTFLAISSVHAQTALAEDERVIEQIVKSIDVLRDGASAQYGSDALAGVINLRLRDELEGDDLSVQYGTRESSYETLTVPAPANANFTVPSNRVKRDVSDGETPVVNILG